MQPLNLVENPFGNPPVNQFGRWMNSHVHTILVLDRRIREVHRIASGSGWINILGRLTDMQKPLQDIAEYFESVYTKLGPDEKSVTRATLLGLRTALESVMLKGQDMIALAYDEEEWLLSRNKPVLPTVIAEAEELYAQAKYFYNKAERDFQHTFDKVMS
jgi:hypothetical protein